MGVLEWKADMYDKYQALIDEGRPIWEWDKPAIVDNCIKMSMFNNVTGEIRLLCLTMTDLVQLNKTGAFDRSSAIFGDDRKRFEEFVESVRQ